MGAENYPLKVKDCSDITFIPVPYIRINKYIIMYDV